MGKYVTAIKNEIGLNEYDHGVENSNNITMYEITPDEFRRVWKSGFFDMINERCYLMVDEYESETIMRDQIPDCINALKECGITEGVIHHVFKQEELHAVGFDF